MGGSPDIQEKIKKCKLRMSINNLFIIFYEWVHVCIHLYKSYFKILLTEAKMIQIHSEDYAIRLSKI